MSRAAKKAREAAVRYAASQHRYRAEMISVTGLAFASTAADERVRGICGKREGVTVPPGETFDFTGRDLYSGHKAVPPAHPWCRCALAYIEDDAYAADFAGVDDNSGLKPADDSGTIQSNGTFRSDGQHGNFPVSEDAIKKIPVLDIFNDHIQNLRYSAACRHLLREIKRHPNLEIGTEFSVVFDTRMKPIMGCGYITGEVDKVKIANPNVMYHAFHNHGSGDTLSFVDILNFATRQRQMSITAIGNNGNVYCLLDTNRYSRKYFKKHLLDKTQDTIYTTEKYSFSLQDVFERRNEDNPFPELTEDQINELEQAVKNTTLKIITEGVEKYGLRYIHYNVS